MSPKEAIALLEREAYTYLTVGDKRRIVALIRRLDSENQVYRQVVMNAAEKSGQEGQPS